jgi:hypothetical protein
VFDVQHWRGTLASADPDQVIRDVAFCALPDALDKLTLLPWRTMREPLVAYLSGEVPAGSVWCYRQSNPATTQLVSLIMPTQR